MMDDLPGDEPPTFHQIWPAALRVIYGIALLAIDLFVVILFIFWAIVGVSVEEVLPQLGTMAVILAVTLPPAMGLTLRRNWGRWAGVGFGVVAAVFAVFAMRDGFLVGVYFAVPFALMGALLLLPPVTHEFSREARQVSFEQRKRRLRFVVLLSLGLGLVWLVGNEAQRVADEVRMYRLDSTCEESGDVEACGHVALMRIRSADDVEDVEKGAETLRELCDDQNSGSCRVYALTRSYSFAGVMRDGSDLVSDVRQRRAVDACLQDDVRGCWVVAVTTGSPQNDLAAVVAKTDALCDAGEELACWANAQRILRASPAADAALESDDEATLRKACDADFRRACTRLGRAPAGDARTRCWNGELELCAALADAAPPHEARVYRALAEAATSDRRVPLAGLSIDSNEGFDAACAEGSAVACLGAGLWLTRFAEKKWRPDLPPAEELASTFGRSCSLGMNVACRAYAHRLQNRPVRAERRVEVANEQLQRACDRDDGQSCWLIDRGEAIWNGDYAPLREQALRACEQAPMPPDWLSAPCRTHANLVAVEAGFSSTPLDDRVAYSLLRETCARWGDPASCTRVTYLHLDSAESSGHYWRLFLPLHSTAYDAAAVACSRDYAWGCSLMPRVASAFPWGAESTQEEVKKSVCEKKASMCDDD